MSLLDKQSATQLQNGLNKDLTFQREGDVTYALNAIRDSHDGGKYDYQSEPGNEFAAILNGAAIVGIVYGQDDEVYLFATEGFECTIGIFKKNKYTEHVRAVFNWSVDNPITGESRVKNGCERLVYWCDALNNDYFYNFDKPEEFKTGNVFDVNKFKLVPSILPVKMDLISVNNSGGLLSLGSYYFQAEILDENQNSLFTSDVSPQVVIYDNSSDEDYNRINGGLNIAQYSAESGGVPLVTKSISLKFYNLNPAFKYLRVNVFRKIAGSNQLDGHTVAELIPIGNGTVNWTYKGLNTAAGDFPIDVNEKFVDNARYDSAYVMEQVQGRLLRANLKQDVRDYSEYQNYVSKIVAKWVAKEVESNNIESVGNPKNPQTYWTGRGFQGDEVYMFGIQFIHKDGSISPVFPLIGKSSIPSDTFLYTVVANTVTLPQFNEVWLSDVEHLGYQIGDQVPSWKFKNGAIITSSQVVTHPYSYEGDFGFYETDETYPDIRDCNNNLIWGTDADDNPITTSTKVRLFQFPDRRTVSHTSTDAKYLIPLGVKFSDITYPNSDVVGHKFVYAERTEFDKTVVDSGWAVKPSSTELGIKLGQYRVGGSAETITADPFKNDTNNSTYLRFISSNVLYKQRLGSFDYYKLNRAHRFDSGLVSTNGDLDYARTSLKAGGFLASVIMYMKQTNHVITSRLNHKQLQSILVKPNTITEAQGYFPKIYQEDLYTGDSVSKISYTLENSILPTQITDDWHLGSNTQYAVNNFYVYKKALVNPYSNFLVRKYKSIHHNYTTSVFSQDNVYYGGDTLITENSNFRVAFFYRQVETAGSYIMTPLFCHHYEEHDINTALRHEGSGENFKYFKMGDTDEINYNRLTYYDGTDRVLNQRNNVQTLNVETEYYAYNDDYTVDSVEKSKIPIPSSFDYCSDCLYSYPNRIIFSPKSFDEESYDLYRISKINDYIDIPANKGKITGLKYINNYLLVHTEDALFILQPNPQSFVTDINNVYISTGDFLGIPPQEINQTEMGYAGMQTKLDCVNTPFGHIWADQKRGQIFNFNEKIEELTNPASGMSSWFKQELPSKLNAEFYRVYGIPYPYQSPYNGQIGIGLNLVYDPRYKRLLITNTDYSFLNNGVYGLKTKAEFDATQQGLYFDFDQKAFKTKSDSQIVSSYLYHGLNMINESWNLSYSFETNSWTSFHSYIPRISFFDTNHYYTFENSPNEAGNGFNLNAIWRHKHIGNYQKYYNTKRTFAVEWQIYKPSTEQLSTVHYFANTWIWDEINYQWIPSNLTFNYGMFYTNDQNTGLVGLSLLDQNQNPYQNIQSSNSLKYIIRTDDNYKISGLYDMSSGPPVVSKSKDNDSVYGVDIFASGTDFTKSSYQTSMLKSKVVNCRLYFYPYNVDAKKVINIIQTNKLQSIR